MTPNDTIVALATPPGEGAIAVVRVSGPAALSVVGRYFVPSRRGLDLTSVCTHSVVHGRFCDGVRLLDEVLVTVFRAPRTYTCEDLVEIGCHGGLLITRRILEALIAGGARAATPGEFTRRAFLNGRLDLAQAEAVADLIRARSETAAQVALGQLQGRLSYLVSEAREVLLDAVAHLEAQLDFSEEDLAPDQGQAMQSRLEIAKNRISQLLKSAREGRVLREGFRVAIVGCPNAGKSSLMNVLLGENRAIVTRNPGTTRDTLEELVEIDGWPILLIDTAGWREADDEAEIEGIRRGNRAGKSADMLIHLVDASVGWQASDETLAEQFKGQAIQVVWNKSDLGYPDLSQGQAGIVISCVTGFGLEQLKNGLVSAAGAINRSDDGGLVAINARHADILRRAEAALSRAVQASIAGVSPDLVSLEVSEAISATGEILGGSTSDAVLDRLFLTFCLGK